MQWNVGENPIDYLINCICGEECNLEEIKETALNLNVMLSGSDHVTQFSFMQFDEVGRNLLDGFILEDSDLFVVPLCKICELFEVWCPDEFEFDMTTNLVTYFPCFDFVYLMDYKFYETFDLVMEIWQKNPQLLRSILQLWRIKGVEAVKIMGMLRDCTSVVNSMIEMWPQELQLSEYVRGIFMRNYGWTWSKVKILQYNPQLADFIIQVCRRKTEGFYKENFKYFTAEFLVEKLQEGLRIYINDTQVRADQQNQNRPPRMRDWRNQQEH